MGRVGRITVKPNSRGARAVLKSEIVSEAINNAYVKPNAPNDAIIYDEISGVRRVIRVARQGEHLNPLKKREQESGDLLGILSKIGKPSRVKYNTRLKRNRKRREKARYRARKRSS